MRIGDIIYYVNSGREIDKYIIKRIKGNDALIVYDGDLPISVTIDLSKIDESPRLFKTQEEAIDVKNQLDIDYKLMTQKRFEKILEEALNSPTLMEVETCGMLLGRKEGIIKDYSSVGKGAWWKEVNLYEYDGKRYIIVYRCTNQPSYNKECISFYEKK